MRKVVFPSGLLLSANQRRIYDITSLLPTISGYAPFSLVNAYYYGSMNILTLLNDLEYNDVGKPTYARLLMVNLINSELSSDGEHYYFNMYYRKI